jgi:hypothetical protein
MNPAEIVVGKVQGTRRSIVPLKRYALVIPRGLQRTGGPDIRNVSQLTLCTP